MRQPGPPLARLLRHTSRHRGAVWLATTCSVLNKVFDLAPPLLIGLCVDTVVERENSLLAGRGVVDPSVQLLVLVGLSVVIWVLESLFEYAFGVLWRNLAQTVQHELRLEAWHHVQQLDLQWFGDQRRGDLLAVLVDDVNQLERFLDKGANELLQVGTTVVVIGALFFWTSPTVAVLSFLPIPVILFGSFRFQATIAPHYAQVRREAGNLAALFENALDGIATIRAFGTERLEAARVEAASLRYRDANRGAIHLSSAFIPIIRMAILGGFCATLLVAGWFTLDGAMAVGTYSVLVYMTQRLLWPLTRLGETFDLYQRAMASTDRILDLLGTERIQRDGERALPEPVRGHVRFEGVRFGWPDRPLLFDGLDLELAPGRTTALVGPTGAGKTTLVRLLLRLDEPTAGRITVDGVPIGELRAASLRSAIALVSQHVTLFPGTIRENIAYGRPDASDTEVLEAARAAELGPFVTSLPAGLDTQVGEGGLKLSGGQRQRIGIARAILRDAPILVLDEATSAVDNETEAALQRSLERLGVGRTTLVIAHRLSTVRRADHIVVLDQGRVVARGTHDALVAEGGLYARLWAVQTGAPTDPSPTEARP